MVELVLQRGGYEVYTVDSGQAGLELAKVVQPMCVVTDFAMPGMHGHVFVQRFRAEPDLVGVPVLLVASRAEEVAELFGELCSGTAVLPKPFEPDDLLREVANLIEEAYGVLAVGRPQRVDVSEESAIELLEAFPGGPEPAPAPAAPVARATSEQIERCLEHALERLLPPLIEVRLNRALERAGMLDDGDFAFGGSLAAVPLPDALNFAAYSGVSGRLIVANEEVFGEILVDSGHFLGASVHTRDGHDLLGSLLLNDEQRPLEPRALERALDRAAANQQHLGETLVQDGEIDREHLLEVLGSQAVSAFHRLIEQKCGRFRLELGPIPARVSEVGLRIPLVKLMMEAMRVLDEKAEADEAFPDEQIVLARADADHVPLDDFEVNVEESEHLARVDGETPLAMLIHQSSASAAETKRIYHRLLTVGLVQQQRAA